MEPRGCLRGATSSLCMVGMEPGCGTLHYIALPCPSIRAPGSRGGGMDTDPLPDFLHINMVTLSIWHCDLQTCTPLSSLPLTPNMNPLFQISTSNRSLFTQVRVCCSGLHNGNCKQVDPPSLLCFAQSCPLPMHNAKVQGLCKHSSHFSLPFASWGITYVRPKGVLHFCLNIIAGEPRAF